MRELDNTRIEAPQNFKHMLPNIMMKQIREPLKITGYHGLQCLDPREDIVYERLIEFEKISKPINPVIWLHLTH